MRQPGFPPGYATLRAVRLYPLYFAGLVPGTLALAWRLPVADWPLIGSALPAGALMLPFPAAMRTPYPGPEVHHYFYPLDFPAWSLFFELLASVSYGVFHRYLTPRALLAIMAICAFALIVAAFTSGIDGGAIWPTFHLGFARVGYAFPAGLLLYRLRRSCCCPAWCCSQGPSSVFSMCRYAAPWLREQPLPLSAPGSPYDSPHGAPPDLAARNTP